MRHFQRATQNFFQLPRGSGISPWQCFPDYPRRQIFFANSTRIDWLQRLVLSKAEGRRKPNSRQLSRALNSGLSQAGVLRLEDPIEDLFCEVVATRQGSYRIFPGQWESAGPYTQTLLAAFESLPDATRKQHALESVHALLRVSDELVSRSNVNQFTSSGGNPQGVVSVPGNDALTRLAKRVKFTDSDIERLGVCKEALSPFFLQPDQFPYVSDREPGETPLEFHPLLEVNGGLLAISPASISTAVRAVLIHAAKEGGMGDALLAALMVEQERYSGFSRFWPVPHLRLSTPNEYGMRTSVWQFAEGRFLQVIQLPSSFDGFPGQGFATVRRLPETFNAFIAAEASRFWEFTELRADCRQSVTVLLLSGWGEPFSVVPGINDSEAPDHWQLVFLSFADAACLGACEDGNFQDLCRIHRQVDLLEQDGFSFSNLSGTLNLFGFWRMTGGNLVPEHMLDVSPPAFILMPSDALLAPRIESAAKRNLQSLPFGDGSFKLVQRVDWSDDADLQPIYGSLEDVEGGRLVGAVALDDRIVWVDVVGGDDSSREYQYRIWQAALQWIEAVGLKITQKYPQGFPPGVFHVSLSLPSDNLFTDPDRRALDGSPVSSTIKCVPREGVQVSKEWSPHLWKRENDAEIELAAAIFKAMAFEYESLSRDILRQEVRNAIPSSDWRWMHAGPVRTPVERLAAKGLIGDFRKSPWSSLTLAKCGSVWSFYSRANDLEIDGERECQAFLARYRNQILETLIGSIRRYDRLRLVRLAADRYQAARLEQYRWRRSIRALRAIHGGAADSTAFERQISINSVQRTAKAICEIAAGEAVDEGGLEPGSTDLDDLFGIAALLMANGELFAAMRAGLIKPSLRISPAGDLLSERSVFETTLRPGAEWLNTRALNSAAATYPRERTAGETETPPDTMPWPSQLREAIEAEYGVSAESFIDFQFAVVRLMEERDEPVTVVRRSELLERTTCTDRFSSDNIAPLAERFTLCRRSFWNEHPDGFTEPTIDLTRLDRPVSVINRPLLALDDEADPLVLVAPLFISDATMYSLSGLMEGSLQGSYWSSAESKAYAGAQANAAGEAFEVEVADRLNELGLTAWPRCKLSWALNAKVDESFGDVDVLAVSQDKKTVWVIEAKNLRLCRTVGEAAARLTEYRGVMTRDRKNCERPDKMLRHLQRVKYLREKRVSLCGRLKLDEPPIVRGMLIVDSPQPMNFYMLQDVPDAESVFLDAIAQYRF